MLYFDLLANKQIWKVVEFFTCLQTNSLKTNFDLIASKLTCKVIWIANLLRNQLAKCLLCFLPCKQIWRKSTITASEDTLVLCPYSNTAAEWDKIGELSSYHHISKTIVWKYYHPTISIWSPTNSGVKIYVSFQNLQ